MKHGRRLQKRNLKKTDLYKRKIEKLEKILMISRLLKKAIEDDKMDVAAELMKRRELTMKEIERIDQKIKDGIFFEQKGENFRYIKKLLSEIQEEEKKIMNLAREKLKKIEEELLLINKELRLRGVYKSERQKQVNFERTG